MWTIDAARVDKQGVLFVNKPLTHNSDKLTLDMRALLPSIPSTSPTYGPLLSSCKNRAIRDSIKIGLDPKG